MFIGHGTYFMKRAAGKEDLTGRYARINNVCLVILAAAAVTTALIYMRAILVPFVISLFMYAVISPAVRLFQRRLRFPKALAVVSVVVLFLVVSALLILFISSSLREFLESADAYRERIAELAQSSVQRLRSMNTGFDMPDLVEELRDIPFFSIAGNITRSAVSIVSNTVLVVIITVFLIAGEGTTKNSNPVVSEIRAGISRYISTKLSMSLLTGILVGLLLSAFGVELAFLFAVLTVLLNFIPNVGSIVATLLPLPVLFLQFGLGWKFSVILAASTLIQFVIGNILEPKLLGESMDLHPVTVLLFLMFWGLVWGVPGMFLAVPITAIMKIILGRIETTKKVAELLAGRF